MLEIPEIITKTRKLVVLRGFQVNELLEFKDRFVMYPEKIEDSGTTKSAVWVFKEERVVGVAL